MTGLDISNASLLDESTAAAEAMSLCYRYNKRKKVYLSDNLHPQTISVVETRLKAFEIDVIVGPIESIDFSNHEYSGVLLQYPDTYGNVVDFEGIASEAQKNGVRNFKIENFAKLQIIFLDFSLCCDGFTFVDSA